MAEQAVEQQSESEAPDKQADGTPAPVSTEEPAAQGGYGARPYSRAGGSIYYCPRPVQYFL